jgi:hypothetical protein
MQWYQFKLLATHSTGVSMDALHIIVGFMGVVGIAALSRRPLSSVAPFLAVLAAELVNESFDFHLERWPDPGMQWGESIKDVFLTMVIPLALLVLARFRPTIFISDEKSTSSAHR